METTPDITDCIGNKRSHLQALSDRVVNNEKLEKLSNKKRLQKTLDKISSTGNNSAIEHVNLGLLESKRIE